VPVEVVDRGQLARRWARRLVLSAVGLAIGVALVVALREATLSTHEEVPPDSYVELVVDGRVRHGERDQTVEEMVEAQILACRLEVNSDVVGDVEPEGEVESMGGGRYRAVLRPAMDLTNRKQFRGCLEDWLIDGFQLDVIRLERIEAGSSRR
jgi:hypothetical protein